VLKQRVITAALLLAVLLPVLLLESVWPFALLTLAMVGAAGWEWARLNGWAGAGAWAFGAVVALAGEAMLAGLYAAASQLIANQPRLEALRNGT